MILRLQENTCTLRQARVYSDYVLDLYSTLFARLHTSARTLHSASFGSGAVKIQERREENLADTEKRALRDLPMKSLWEDVEDESSESIVQRALKRLKNDQQSTRSVFPNTKYLLSKWNICKLLFSVSGHALTNRRRGNLPSKFERQLFFYMNADYGDVSVGKEIVENNKDDGQYCKLTSNVFSLLHIKGDAHIVVD